MPCWVVWSDGLLLEPGSVWGTTKATPIGSERNALLEIKINALFVHVLNYVCSPWPLDIVIWKAPQNHGQTFNYWLAGHLYMGIQTHFSFRESTTKHISASSLLSPASLYNYQNLVLLVLFSEFRTPVHVTPLPITPTHSPINYQFWLFLRTLLLCLPYHYLIWILAICLNC